MHQKQVMETSISGKKTLIRKVFTLTWGGFWLVWKRVNADNGRWKHIYRINSAMRIKKSHVTLHNLTNQWTDLVAQHLKCGYGHSEMTEQSLSSKYFWIIASWNCLTQQHSQTAGIQLGKHWPHLLCFVCSFWCASNLLLLYTQWLHLIFFVM